MPLPSDLSWALRDLLQRREQPATRGQRGGGTCVSHPARNTWLDIILCGSGPSLTKTVVWTPGHFISRLSLSLRPMGPGSWVTPDLKACAFIPPGGLADCAEEAKVRQSWDCWKTLVSSAQPQAPSEWPAATLTLRGEERLSAPAPHRPARDPQAPGSFLCSAEHRAAGDERAWGQLEATP